MLRHDLCHPQKADDKSAEPVPILSPAKTCRFDQAWHLQHGNPDETGYGDVTASILVCIRICFRAVSGLQL